MASRYTDQKKAEFEAELAEPIEAIQTELAQLREQDASKMGTYQRSRHYSQVDWAEERLLRAQQRTDADRPQKCWCHGAGGVGKDRIRLDQDISKFMCEEYCSCEAGRARRNADLEVRQEQYRLERRAVLDRWLEELPPSFRAFRAHELTTYPTETDAQRAVVKQLGQWTGNDEPDHDEVPESDVLKPWLYLHGPVGTGKTGLSVALAKQLTLDSQRVVIVDVAGLLSRIRRTYSKGADEVGGDVMSEMQDADVLILDDFGAERITDWVHEQLFALINFRYGDYDRDNPKLTVITSNYTLAELAEHIGGVAGERIAWRIGERSLVVSLEGCENLRAPKTKRGQHAETTGAQGQSAKVVPIKGQARTRLGTA